MDNGCLIKFEDLKVGDELFDTTYGEMIVNRIDVEEVDYPIRCNKKTSKNNSGTYTKDGKVLMSAIFPRLFSKDPFKYAFEQVKDYRRQTYIANQENNRLWTENQELKEKIKILQRKKDV